MKIDGYNAPSIERDELLDRTLELAELAQLAGDTELAGWLAYVVARLKIEEKLGPVKPAGRALPPSTRPN